VTQKWKNTGMRLAVNGVWGNLGVASAALITGYLIDNGGWRMAFIIPGSFSLAVGVAYGLMRREEISTEGAARSAAGAGQATNLGALFWRVSLIVFLTTAVSSIIFQATTFALPKIFDERLQGLSTEAVGWLQSHGLGGRADVATMVGVFAFTVFAVASMAQLVVGSLLDRVGARPVFMGAAAIQLVFFGLMAGSREGWALALALGFMLGAFGQIPINDFMIGKMASGAARARVYGIRYVVSFTALAAALPLISIVYQRWGFDTLFYVLSAAAAVILALVSCLPRQLPAAGVATA
jgi:MFS family permease